MTEVEIKDSDFKGLTVPSDDYDSVENYIEKIIIN